MIGARGPDATVHYPVNEVAAQVRRVGRPRRPTVPAEAYADWSAELTPTRLTWPP